MSTPVAPGGGGVGTSQAFQLVSPGILTRFSVASTKIFQVLGEQYWAGHLSDTRDVDNGVLHTLVSGYIQWPNTLSWEGLIELKADQYFIVTTVGQLLQGASAIDARLTTTVNGAIMQFALKIDKLAKEQT